MGEWFGDEYLEGEAPSVSLERYPPISITEQQHYRFLHDVGVCAATGQTVPIDVEHLSGNEHLMGKVAGGTSQKPHFAWTIPLSRLLHYQKTARIGYSVAFQRMGWPIEDIDHGPLPTALALVGFSALGDAEGARRWLMAKALHRMAERTIK